MVLSEAVKERLDLVEVVSGYVPDLQRAGRNFKARCPFHAERTPSFYVFPERQTWRCFGACATGGDVFSFVMAMEKVEFPDALKLLAKRAGVSLPARRVQEEHHILHQVNGAAIAFFQETLGSRAGSVTREYLKKRDVSQESISQFALGLSPPQAGKTLVEHLLALGHSRELLVASGLAIQAQEGALRDLFRGRLMFPIHDEQGRPAGFGGRALDGSEPKYLNSPKTQVFDKGRLLYAYHRARGPIEKTKEAVVVEGYMDAIAAHQHGFQNVVASMGTSLTEAQAGLLKGSGRRIVLALDPDAAGREATFRSLESSWKAFETQVIGRGRRVTLYQRQASFSLSIALLPPGKDPDEVVHQDPTAWARLIQEAPPLLEYLFTTARERWPLDTPAGKAQAAEHLYPLIASSLDPWEQERSFRRLAEALGVSLATLEAAMGGPLSRPRARTAARSETAQVSASPFEAEKRDTLEEHLLAALLQHPELRDHVAALPPETFSRWENRETFTRWITCSTIEELRSNLPEELRPRLESLLALALPPQDRKKREEAVRETCLRLEERYLRHLKEEEGLLLASEAPTEEERTRLEQRMVETNERLRALFAARLELRGAAVKAKEKDARL